MGHGVVRREVQAQIKAAAQIQQARELRARTERDRLERLDFLRMKFGEVDADNSGSIDKDEVRVLVASLMGTELSDAQFDAALREMDPDLSGSVSFAEFQSWCSGEQRSGGLPSHALAPFLFVAACRPPTFGVRPQPRSVLCPCHRRTPGSTKRTPTLARASSVFVCASERELTQCLLRRCRQRAAMVGTAAQRAGGERTSPTHCDEQLAAVDESAPSWVEG